jgi:hypothetical protein
MGCPDKQCTSILRKKKDTRFLCATHDTLQIKAGKNQQNKKPTNKKKKNKKKNNKQTNKQKQQTLPQP